MGVCCIVFDIDGMLFNFFMFFLNIEKKMYIFFFQYFKFSSRFMLFPTLKKKIGGIFFFRKTILSHFTFYAIFNIKKIWEVVSPNSREGQCWNLYPLYPLFPCSDFVSQMWGGGGVMFFSHFMLFPTFLETKIWEYMTKQLFLI